MPDRQFSTIEPPLCPPGPGRTHYLPEDFYYFGKVSVPLELAARVTARHLARWADRFEVYPLGQPRDCRAGPLPADPDARQAIIDELFDWLAALRVEIYVAVANLYLGDVRLLHQPDGVPGTLALTPDEFADLQRAWEHHGLPRDLYYPADQQRTAIEPVEIHGGLVRLAVRYTPLRWLHRDHAAMETMQVPSDEQRARSFAAACRQFMQALLLRMAELSEPGRETARTEIAQLGALHREVMFASLRARGAEVAASELPEQPD